MFKPDTNFSLVDYSSTSDNPYTFHSHQGKTTNSSPRTGFPKDPVTPRQQEVILRTHEPHSQKVAGSSVIQWIMDA